jgi:glyoxylase-like metal-dependent hydrolase (beta-lactamase superfamily II)
MPYAQLFQKAPGVAAMKIIPLLRSHTVSSSNSYLVLGTLNRPDDVNTIIDPGADNFVIDEIERLFAGFGKVRMSQVILTHNHLNHAGAAMAVKKRYNSRILAFSKGVEVDELLMDGQFIKAGDDNLEVLHTPGHSPDSVCLYAPSEKALVSGDTQLHIMVPGDGYVVDYIESAMKIACRDVQRIYAGHGEPVTSGCQEIIMHALERMRATRHG